MHALSVNAEEVKFTGAPFRSWPAISGGNSYMVAHFKEAPAAPRPVEAPKPAHAL